MFTKYNKKNGMKGFGLVEKFTKKKKKKNVPAFLDTQLSHDSVKEEKK